MNVKKIYLSVYRTIGMFLLVSMTLALVSYGAMLLFFIFNSTWIAPSVLTPTSDKLLQFRSGYLGAMQNENAANLALLNVQEQVRTLTLKKSMFEAAIGDASKAKTAEIGASTTTIKALTPLIANKQDNVVESKELALASARLLKDAENQLATGLITRNDFVSIQTSVQSFRNQATNGELDLAAATRKLDQERRAVKTLKSSPESLATLGYTQALAALRQSLLETEGMLAIAQASLDSISKHAAFAQQVTANLRETSYMAATKGGANMAFIPYENIDVAVIGKPVYDCTLKIFWCHKIGTVRTVYHDEHVISYPVFNIKLTREVRGVMVDLDISDPESMKSQILFAGGKPLLF